MTAFVSLGILTLKGGIGLLRGRKNDDAPPLVPPDTRLNNTFQRIADSHGGWRIATYRVFRFFLLIGLASSTARRVKLDFHFPKSDFVPSVALALLLAYVRSFFISVVKASYLPQLYSAFLSLAILLQKKYSRRRSLTWHTNAILLACWSTLFYRDIWPLATIPSVPKDNTNAAFWFHFSALSIAALAIPFCIPREYVSVNPEVVKSFSFSANPWQLTYLAETNSNT